MQSRSARWSSRVSGDRLIDARASLAIGLGLGLLAPCEAAWATLTITPKNFGGQSIVNNTAFYASTSADGATNAFTTGAADAPFMDPTTSFSFGVVDLSQVQGSALSGALSFEVTPSVTLNPNTSTQRAMLAIVVSGTVGSNTHYAPFAGVNSTACDASVCPTFVGNTVAGYFFAVPISQTGTTVQIFPKDICGTYAAQVGGGTASGCDTSSPGVVKPADPANSVATSAFSLTWQVLYVNTTTGAIDNASVDSGTLNILFQSSTANWTCPTSSLPNLYFPGDEEITFDATGFGASSTTGTAPQTNLIAIGKLYSGATAGTLTRDTTFRSNNDLIDESVFFGAGESISGFVNTTDGTDNKYTLGFMMKDATGAINPSSTSGVCEFGPVQTSPILTFLNESKCFIATAAFRSTDAGPVMMLRRFRDEVLLQTRLGTAFVDWYYRWSPSAAVWLMEHPRFRFPVMVALAPLELAAWLMLNPLFLALFSLAALSGAAGCLGYALGVRLNRSVTR